MRYSRVAPSSLRLLRQLPAMLVCLATLTGCRLGDAVSLFDDPKGIEQSIGTLRERVGDRLMVLNVLIAPDQITIRAQDPKNRGHVDEWRLDRIQVAWINWERTSGPHPYPLALVNPDLEANLFDISEIDFGALSALTRAAEKHAALADNAKVTRMEIAREVFIIPKPSSGEIRWTVDVGNGRESAQVFADARGAIMGMNLDGTNRAKTLDILRELGLMGDAARAFRLIMGSEQILTRVNISSRSIGFETNLPDLSFPIPMSGSLSASRVYTWNLNGLQRAIGTVNADAAFPASANAPFGTDEVDWTILPKVAAAAKEQLAMPEGRVSDIALFKPTNRVSSPLILWKIEITDQNKEKGFILADTTGAVKEVMLPQSRRKPIDWYDPQTMVDTFARMGVQFGKDRRYAEITFFNDKVVVTAENHMEPNVFGQFLVTDSGMERFGSPSLWATKNAPFRIDDLAGLTVERVRDLEAQTLATLKMSPKTISSITIGRGGMDPSPKGNVTIEIRAEEQPFGRAGRVNYELDGTVIKTYLP